MAVDIETSGRVAETAQSAGGGKADVLANCSLPKQEIGKDALGYFAKFDRHSGGREMTDADKNELIRSVGYGERFTIVDEKLVDKAKCSLDQELRSTRELIRTSKKPVVVLFTEPTCSHCKEAINAFLDTNPEFRDKYNVAVVGYANDLFGTEKYGGGIRKVSEELGAAKVNGKSPVPLPLLRGYPSIAVFARNADGVVYGTRPVPWNSNKDWLTSSLTTPAMSNWTRTPGVNMDGARKGFVINLGKW